MGHGRTGERQRLRPVLLALEDRVLLSSFDVTSTADDGSTGTLRWAIAQANAASSASSIDIQLATSPRTITLSQGQLELSNTSASISIYDGAGQGPVTVSGNNASRVFQVDPGVTASFSGLTITGGARALGGGLYNSGAATLTDCNVGGNTAFSKGGGLQNAAAASLTVVNCMISGNVGQGLVNYGTATLTGCTISGNSAHYGTGGGVATYNGGTTTLSSCTISGNSAQDGGGLSNFAATTLTNCTITGNSDAGEAGGLFNSGSTANPGQLILTDCTVSGNSGGAGGLLNFFDVTLTNTIVAGNTGGTGNPFDISGSVAGTYNLIGIGGSGGLSNGIDGNIVLTSLDSLGLAPLADNGGTTQTMALLPGSPALGAGTAASGVTADQRGEPLDKSPDIGAYQSQGFTLAAVTGSTPQSTAPGASFANPLSVSVVANDPLEPVAGSLVTFSVNTGAGGAAAQLSAATAIIGADGAAGVTATANSTGGTYTVSASAGADSNRIDFSLSNLIAISFSGLTDQSVSFGAAGVTLAGTLSSGSLVPQGETVAVTLAATTQQATVGALGAFSTFFNTASLSASGSPYTIHYDFASDGTFASASSTSALTVNRVSPVLNITDSRGTYDGSAFAPSATVTGVGGSAAASLEDITPSLSYYSGTYTSVAQLSGVTPLAGAPSHVGQYTALGSFAGSADYTTATALASLAIAQATPTVGVKDSGGTFNGTAFAATDTVAGVVTGVDSTPGSQLEGITPSLSYYAGTFAKLAQLSGLTPLAGAPYHAGQYTVLASFAGSADYTNATALAGFTIAKLTPEVIWSAPKSISYGTALGSGQLDAQASVPGSFIYDPAAGTNLSAGSSQVLVVTFTPEDSIDYSVAGSATAITVLKAMPTLKLSAPGGTFSGSPIAASVTIAGTAAGIDNTPSASLEFVAPTLTYYAGSETSGPNLGSAPPSATGTYAVVASFAGSVDYTSAQSAPVNFAIGRAVASVALDSSTGSAVFGQSLAFIATVTAAGVTPTGMVTFSDGTTPLGSALLDGTGKATLSISSLTRGSHSITARYSGGGNYQGMTSGAAAESVSQAGTQVVLLPRLLLKKRKVVSVELTAELEPIAPGEGIPTGTVRFIYKKKTLGSASLSGGQATLTEKASSVLNKAITVVYSGDPNFQSSTVTSVKLTQNGLKSLVRPHFALRDGRQRARSDRVVATKRPS
jgi:parallel beta-helix repeat protein